MCPHKHLCPLRFVRQAFEGDSAHMLEKATNEPFHSILDPKGNTLCNMNRPLFLSPILIVCRDAGAVVPCHNLGLGSFQEQYWKERSKYKMKYLK